MFRLHHGVAPVLLALGVLTTALDPARASTLVVKDWVVACDNVRHCEAAGFQSEDDDSPPVALWLARDAGAGTAVSARFTLAPADGTNDVPAPLTLRVGSFTLAGIAPDALLPPEQVRSLLPRLLGADAATLSAGQLHWRLSLAGAKAALLRIDDVQGRLGTPGALVRKGTRAEDSVAAPPPPRRQAIALPAARDGDAKLGKAVLAQVRPRDCWDVLPDAEHPDVQVLRLSATRLLVGRECWRGPYQSSMAFWVANVAPPHAPRRVRFPVAEGEPVDEVVGGEISPDGRMDSFSKGRGPADCGTQLSWVWTTSGFQLDTAATAPLCRGHAGGVMVRTWVSETVQPAAH